MKPLLALAAILAVTLTVATAEARGVSRSKQVVRGHGHVAAAQVVCAPQLQVVAQPQVFYPAPQQVFLPQAQVFYQPQAQIVSAPQVVYAPAAAQVILPQQINCGAQAQVVVPQGRQVVRSRRVVRGNVAAQAVMLPY